MARFEDLRNLFYEDYNNPGMPAQWSTNRSGQPRKITWSLTNKTILFEGRYEYADSWIKKYVRQISHAFRLWDKALDSIQFIRTKQGNNADITLATSPHTRGNLALFTRKIPAGSGEITAARIKLNHSILQKYPTGVQSKVIMHEIGNTLGLGDIRCTMTIRSVMEDKCSPPEPFIGRNKLYKFDQDLIKHIYGEINSTNQSNSIRGTARKDKIIGTNKADRIFGLGGADHINGKNGDDLVDPGHWTQGSRDIIKGGRGSDTFVIKDDYYLYIKDFKIIEDRLDVSQLTSGFDWQVQSGNTYIYNNNGYEVAKIRGKVDLTYVQTVE